MCISRRLFIKSVLTQDEDVVGHPGDAEAKRDDEQDLGRLLVLHHGDLLPRQLGLLHILGRLLVHVGVGALHRLEDGRALLDDLDDLEVGDEDHGDGDDVLDDEDREGVHDVEEGVGPTLHADLQRRWRNVGRLRIVKLLPRSVLRIWFTY